MIINSNYNIDGTIKQLNLKKKNKKIVRGGGRTMISVLHPPEGKEGDRRIRLKG